MNLLKGDRSHSKGEGYPVMNTSPHLVGGLGLRRGMLVIFGKGFGRVIRPKLTPILHLVLRHSQYGKAAGWQASSCTSNRLFSVRTGGNRLLGSLVWRKAIETAERTHALARLYNMLMLPKKVRSDAGPKTCQSTI